MTGDSIVVEPGDELEFRVTGHYASIGEMAIPTCLNRFDLGSDGDAPEEVGYWEVPAGDFERSVKQTIDQDYVYVLSAAHLGVGPIKMLSNQTFHPWTFVPDLNEYPASRGIDTGIMVIIFRFEYGPFHQMLK